MSWFDTIFPRDGGQLAPVDVASAEPFDERILRSLDTLAVASRRSGATVSTQVFSQLRSIDDVIRPLLAHVALHPVVVEREIAIESLVTDYVPTALRLFMELPASEQAGGGPADLSLRKQFTALEKSARQLTVNIHEDSLSALETHAIFIATKFNE